jgi:hypothetical protein
MTEEIQRLHLFHRVLRLAWILFTLVPLSLVAISLLLNGGVVSELTIGLLLLAHGIIFWISFPSSFLVAEAFRSTLAGDIIGHSKYQDFYLLICMAITGFVQWWLLFGPFVTRLRRKPASTESD